MSLELSRAIDGLANAATRAADLLQGWPIAEELRTAKRLSARNARHWFRMVNHARELLIDLHGARGAEVGDRLADALAGCFALALLDAGCL